IANRRRFDEVLTQEWKRLTRDQKMLSLLIADIDFFKKYNDHLWPSGWRRLPPSGGKSSYWDSVAPSGSGCPLWW
ncbi:MAG: diguanylate cyclase, partial [Thermodesulfobacteriota bacterium]|nr:diguanylate cyclase [Thermodesulfobacteriota bacterium]